MKLEFIGSSKLFISRYCKYKQLELHIATMYIPRCNVLLCNRSLSPDFITVSESKGTKSKVTQKVLKSKSPKGTKSKVTKSYKNQSYPKVPNQNYPKVLKSKLPKGTKLYEIHYMQYREHIQLEIEGSFLSQTCLSNEKVKSA